MMKAPVMNTIPQIQKAIAELYAAVEALQEAAKPAEKVEDAPARRGRPRKEDVEQTPEV
jgi:hypothetical protein